MSRDKKLLNNRLILLGLMGLAGWLVVSEGYLWWAKLSQNSQRAANVTLQQDEGESSARDETLRENSSSEALPNRLSVEKQSTFEQVSNIPEGEFNYGGSTTWAPLRATADDALTKRFSAFQLQYTSPSLESGRTAGSGTGIRMLLDGEPAFSQSSRALRAEEIAEAQQNGYELKQVAIAIDGIAFAINSDLGITGLTTAQLKQIYSGQVTNWNELGGPDVKISPYARSAEDSGTAEFFDEAVLEGAQQAPWVQFVENTTMGIRQVSANLGGIYYASAAEIVSQCTIKPLTIKNDADDFVAPYVPPYVENANCPRYRNQLNAQAFQSGAYPLTRDLFVMVKANGGVEEQVGTAYASLMMTDEAAALIESAGFVPAATEN